MACARSGCSRLLFFPRSGASLAPLTVPSGSMRLIDRVGSRTPCTPLRQWRDRAWRHGLVEVHAATRATVRDAGPSSAWAQRPTALRALQSRHAQHTSTDNDGELSVMPQPMLVAVTEQDQKARDKGEEHERQTDAESRNEPAPTSLQAFAHALIRRRQSVHRRQSKRYGLVAESTQV
jgi:hypothetical protein